MINPVPGYLILIPSYMKLNNFAGILAYLYISSLCYLLFSWTVTHSLSFFLVLFPPGTFSSVYRLGSGQVSLLVTALSILQVTHTSELFFNLLNFYSNIVIFTKSYMNLADQFRQLQILVEQAQPLMSYLVWLWDINQSSSRYFPLL